MLLEGIITLFHASIKARKKKKKVFAIQDAQGQMINNPNDVPHAFIDYYTQLLGSEVTDRIHVNVDVIKNGPVLNDEHKRLLCLPFQSDEVRKTLFSIPNNKSPGPDGYSSKFFKDSWDVVGMDVIAAILDFFNSGK